MGRFAMPLRGEMGKKKIPLICFPVRFVLLFDHHFKKVIFSSPCHPRHHGGHPHPPSARWAVRSAPAGQASAMLLLTHPRFRPRRGQFPYLAGGLWTISRVCTLAKRKVSASGSLASCMGALARIAVGAARTAGETPPTLAKVEHRRSEVAR